MLTMRCDHAVVLGSVARRQPYSKRVPSDDDDVPDTKSVASEVSDTDTSVSRTSYELEDTTGTISDSGKSVKFANPLVSQSWDVPRKERDSLEQLFYSALDIARFKEERRCSRRECDHKNYELLMERLDRTGAESFDAGNLDKAFDSFNNSLLIKTAVMDPFDHFSTSTTIHRIADVYSKQGSWAEAKEAYSAALQVLQDKFPQDNDLDTHRAMSTLRQKIAILRRHISNQDNLSIRNT